MFFHMAGKGRVAVLGGGPCGLCAAWDLAAAGVEVVVLERDVQLGGLCQTNGRQGYRFDLGGHRFISRDQSLVERVQKLMGDELLVSERKSAIRFMNRSFKYPLDARDFVLKMSPFLSGHCLASYVLSRVRSRLKPQEERTLEEWLVNRYGWKLYSIFFGPYSTKLWGLTPDKISSDWASQRISLLNLSEVILRLLRLKKGTPRTYAIKYFYPKKGIGDIFRVLGAEVERLGGKIVMGAEVRKVNLKGGRACSVEYSVGGRTETLECDYVISTLLLPDLVGMMSPKPPQDVIDSAGRLRFRSLRFMHIMLDGISDLSPYTWQYIQDGRFMATRLQEPKRRSPYSAPEGKTSAMLEIPCSFGDAVWGMDDRLLYEKSVAELKELGYDLKDKTVGYFTTRALHSYPVYTLDYRENRDRLLNHLKGVGGLVSCGRQGLFDYIFMDDAMLMGFQAAAISGGSGSVGALYDRAMVKDLLEVKSVVTDDKET
jgi:protoporphyrinogen oxidase